MAKTATIFEFLVVTVAIGTLCLMTSTWTSRINVLPSPNQNLALWRDYIDKHRPTYQPLLGQDSHENKCTEEFKNSHYIRLRFMRGSTGNALMQIFGLLATSYTFCYTPVIDLTSYPFIKKIGNYFELVNVVFSDMNTTNFEPLSGVMSKRSRDQLSSGRFNFTLEDRSLDYNIFLSQEKFIRSSIKFRSNIVNETEEYMRESFENKTTVAIHVRRTDRIGYMSAKYVYSDLEWYKEFLDNAIEYMKSNYNNCAFIFLSDDLDWCRDKFHGPDVYFSPFNSAGNDLAVMSQSDHVILTVGTFGWCGAMLGHPKSVLYSRKYGMRKFLERPFFMPSWVKIS